MKRVFSFVIALLLLASTISAAKLEEELVFDINPNVKTDENTKMDIWRDVGNVGQSLNIILKDTEGQVLKVYNELDLKEGDSLPSEIFDIAREHYGNGTALIRYDGKTYKEGDVFVQGEVKRRVENKDTIILVALNEVWLKNGIDFTITGSGQSRTITFKDKGLVQSYSKMDFNDEAGNFTFSGDISTRDGIPNTGCAKQSQLEALYYAGRHGVANCGVFEHYRSSAGGDIFFKNFPSKANLVSNTFKLADTITVTASCECIAFSCDNHSVYMGTPYTWYNGHRIGGTGHGRNGWYDVPNVEFSFNIGTIHLYN